MRIIITILTLLLISPAFSQIYKQVDEDGTVTYTDTPSDPEDEKINLTTGNTVKPFSAPARSASAPDKKVSTRYKTVTITSPNNDQSYHNLPPEEAITISIATTPTLQTNDKIKLTVNGSRHGELSTSGAFSLKALDRGTYTLIASVISKNGKALISSQPISIHVHRFSKLNKINKAATTN